MLLPPSGGRIETRMKNYTAQELITIFSGLNANQTDGLDPGDGWLDLFNRTLLRVYNYRHWTWLIKNVSSQATSGVLELPDDFMTFCDVYSLQTDKPGQKKSPVYNSTKNKPVDIIKRSDRFSISNSAGHDYCYLDMTNNRIVFLDTAISDSFTYDYFYTPEYISDISATTVLPKAMQPSIPHLMSLEFAIIENEDPDRNFDAKNLKTFDEYMKPFINRHTSLVQYG